LHSALFLLQALTNGCKTWVVALKIFAVVFKDLVLHRKRGSDALV
jgi:hypothetical protein